VPDDGEVVGNEHDRQVQPRLEFFEKCHDLRLDRDVERADRLVAHQKFRLQRKSAGDSHTLTLSAAQLSRIAVLEGGVQADQAKQLETSAAPRCARPDAVDVQRLSDDLTHAEPWIEGCVGILKHHLEASARIAQRRATQHRNLAAVEHHATRRDPFQLDEGTSGRTLPAATLADQ
jgi:hypothetical protein